MPTLLQAWPSSDPSPADVTGSMVALGNPFTGKPVYARNVWDMQAYGGKIYVSHGDSVANTGDTPIYSLDPATDQFTTIGITKDEAIDSMRVMNNKLYIPGMDATEDWTFGNFYTYDGSNFTKFRTLPDASHVSDVYVVGSLLYATGSGMPGSAAQVSADNGSTWTPVPDVFLPGPFFELNGELYISATQEIKKLTNGSFTALPYSQFMPGVANNYLGYFFRRAFWQSSMVFIADNGSQDHTPVGLYVTTGPNQSSKFTLPIDTLPRDLLTRSEGVYMLTSQVQQDNTVKNVVSVTSDLVNWEELFWFTSATFARSFEEVNGIFYFGLGSDNGANSDDTGNVLKFTYS